MRVSLFRSIGLQLLWIVPVGTIAFIAIIAGIGSAFLIIITVFVGVFLVLLTISLILNAIPFALARGHALFIKLKDCILSR